jgi:hypothetical protein
MLMTFLRHNIPLDEVRCYQALGFIRSLDHDPVGDGLDLLREYNRHVVYGLRAVQAQSPRTRINVIDTTNCYTRPLGDSAAYETAIWPRPFNPIFMGLKRDFESFDLQCYVNNLGSLPAGVVYGVDKPMLRVVGNKLYLFFSDVNRSGLYTVFAQKTPMFDYEMFYWGLPAITIKQAHVVKRALERNPAALDHIRRTKSDVYLDTGIPGIDLSLIYSDWRRQVYTKEQSDDPRMISHFIDGPVAEITALRRRMVTDLFRDGRTDGFISMTQTKVHYVGTIDALQTAPHLDQDE